MSIEKDSEYSFFLLKSKLYFIPLILKFNNK
jgi:hypothetical protein